MRVSVLLIAFVALVVAIVITLGGETILNPDLPLIIDAGFGLETITPNADGASDIVEYHYELSSNAEVTISFTSDAGEIFLLRDGVQREQNQEYRGLFSGVVDGYVLDGEDVAGEVTRRLMPNGTYAWEITAETSEGELDVRSGTLTLTDADAELPELPVFTISPQTFSPNQDSVRDRTQINIVLAKDAVLDVYLVDEVGVQTFLAPRVGETRNGEAGRYIYDYDGGIDAGAEPPPDGTYRVVAAAQDAVGQRVERADVLTLQQGGKPLAEIAAQSSGADVVFTSVRYREAFYGTESEPGELIAEPDDPQTLSVSDLTLPVGDVLLFWLVVDNYSDVPIRTHGAPPGTVYDQNQSTATFGDYDESGAWRVGIECDTTFNYPWRWRIGTDETLEVVNDPLDGNTYYYLPPGERAVVWGGIRMTELIETRNPQNCFAGLIHEDVNITVQNSRVGARSVELVDPNATLYD